MACSEPASPAEQILRMPSNRSCRVSSADVLSRASSAVGARAAGRALVGGLLVEGPRVDACVHLRAIVPGGAIVLACKGVERLA